MSKDRRLGRGLAALLGTTLEQEVASAPAYDERADAGEPPVQAASTVAAATSAISGLFDLNVYEIDDNPFQPRREFSDVEIATQVIGHFNQLHQLHRRRAQRGS